MSRSSSAAAFAISTPSSPGSEKGIDRVILGTAAVRDPALVREAARDFPGCIAVGIDARDGKVAIEGWAETSEMTALDLARRFEDAGVAAIIHTDIARDGVLEGLNLEATAALARAVTIPVIASGGLAGDRRTCSDCSSRATPCWKAPSPDARSMTAASIRARRWRCSRIAATCTEGQRLSAMRARTIFIILLVLIFLVAFGPALVAVISQDRSPNWLWLPGRSQPGHSLRDRRQGLRPDLLRSRLSDLVFLSIASGRRRAVRLWLVAAIIAFIVSRRQTPS